MIGMTVNDTTYGTTVANLGMEEVRFPKLVFQGDTLRACSEVVTKRASKLRPGQGIVEFRYEAINQRDDVVASCRRSAWMLDQS